MRRRRKIQRTSKVVTQLAKKRLKLSPSRLIPSTPKQLPDDMQLEGEEEEGKEEEGDAEGGEVNQTRSAQLPPHDRVSSQLP